MAANDNYETVMAITHSLEDANTMAITPDGKFVLVGGDDNSIVKLDRRTGAEVARINNAHAQYIDHVAVAPNNDFFVSCEDQVVNVWNMDFSSSSSLQHDVDISRVAISPDSTLIACGIFTRGELIIWKLGGGVLRESERKQ